MLGLKLVHVRKRDPVVCYVVVDTNSSLLAAVGDM